MTDIKDILTNQEVTPSPDCWGKLSNRLDMVMPQGAESAAQAAASATSQSSSLLGSLAAKIVAGVIGAAAVATGITVAVMSGEKMESAETPVQKVEKAEVTPSENSESVYEVKTVETHNTAPAVVAPMPAESALPEDARVTIKEEVQHQPLVVATPQPAPSVVESVVPRPVSQTVSKQAEAKARVERPAAPVAQTVKQDPVVQNLSEEELDWTPPVVLQIPNVFTPNGDGYNDQFVIVGIENCMQRKLVVHNRAGQVVYSSNSYENTWDGGDCPDGVYHYQFVYTGFNGIEQTLNGVVTIIRR